VPETADYASVTKDCANEQKNQKIPGFFSRFFPEKYRLTLAI
jgi:hypothetical protein